MPHRLPVIGITGLAKLATDPGNDGIAGTVLKKERQAMTYELKGGEEVKDGKLYGWTGSECARCKGTGVKPSCDTDNTPCGNCGGTGDEWGLMPVQPADLPVPSDKYCITMPNGDCISDHSLCIHNQQPR